jgi:hypothetical protein
VEIQIKLKIVILTICELIKRKNYKIVIFVYELKSRNKYNKYYEWREELAMLQ